MTFKKRFLALFATTAIIFTSVPAYADETISLPPFTVTINSLQIDNSRLEYPIIVHDNITYFPMTYEFCQGLGLKIGFNADTGLSISSINSSEQFKVSYTDKGSYSDTGATLPSYDIVINGQAIDNLSEPYPILNYKGITYFPMTWRFAVDEFNWAYTFDTNTGLNIKASQRKPSEDIAEEINDEESATQLEREEPLKIINALDYSKNLPSAFNSYNAMGSNVRSLFVRDQGNSGTCWAFAANTLFELSLAAQKQVYLDFSEDHLILNTSIPVTYDSGGYIDMATSYYNNWVGPVVDPTDVFGDSLTNNTLKPQYIVTDYIEVSDSIDDIKYAIHQYGAVQSSIGYDEAENYYDDKTAGFYNYDSNSKMTHDIVIVGWDDSFLKDNFKVTPKQDGAFIVQNSWGEDWGEDGLFYVSYDDVHIKKRATALTRFEPYDASKHLYSYIETVITLFEGYTEHYRACGLNVFNAQPEIGGKVEYLTEVGFYTTEEDTSFEIFFSDSGMPADLNPVLESVGSGIAAFPGYHTVKLKTPLPLRADSKFSVGVNFENGESIFLVPLEATYPDIDYTIIGSGGESYISAGANEYEFEDVNDYREHANIGIRAITEMK